jgi:hypothetical protein
MVGNNKVQFIKENLKIHDFDYLGNSHKDITYLEVYKKSFSYKCISQN